MQDFDESLTRFNGENSTNGRGRETLATGTRALAPSPLGSVYGGGAGRISDRPSRRDAETGITFRHTDGSTGKRYIVETVSCGLALFDYDGDGLIDIYFLNGAPLPRHRRRRLRPTNALYRNRRRLAVHRRDRRGRRRQTRATGWAWPSATTTTTATRTST